MTKPLDLFIRESLAIEGVEFLTLPSDRQLTITRAHERFLYDDPITLSALVDFVRVVEPEARLRTIPGMNVSVAGHNAMPGGEQVKRALLTLIDAANGDKRPKRVMSFDYYWRYLHLHPFSDCNGRSARVLWARLLGGIPECGFLDEFHYQALMWQDAYRPVEDRPASSDIA